MFQEVLLMKELGFGKLEPVVKQLHKKKAKRHTRAGPGVVSPVPVRARLLPSLGSGFTTFSQFENNEPTGPVFYLREER